MSFISFIVSSITKDKVVGALAEKAQNCLSKMKLFQVLVVVLFAKALGRKDRKLEKHRRKLEKHRNLAAGTGSNGFRFGQVSVPQSDERHFTRASSTLTINGETTDIGFKSILKTGYRVGNAVAGMLLDIDGDPIFQLFLNNTVKLPLAEISVNADFISITTGKDGKKYLMSHWEDSPGQMYASEIEVGSACDVVVKSMIPVATCVPFGDCSNSKNSNPFQLTRLNQFKILSNGSYLLRCPLDQSAKKLMKPLRLR